MFCGPTLAVRHFAKCDVLSNERYVIFVLV